MSNIGSRPEQSTTAEATLLTQLNNLPASPAGFSIAKNADGTFSNITTGSAVFTAAEVTFLRGIADPTYLQGQLLIGNSSTGGLTAATLTAGAGITISNGNGTITIASTSVGTVSNVSVVTANGFTGTVANASTTPAITLTTNINSAVLAGNGTAISAASTTGSGSTVVLATGPTMTSPIVGTQATTDNSTKAASTAYVTTAINNAIAGVNPAVAAQAATTAASDTSGLTYNNGVAGIGATFTGSNNTAITVDGYTFTALGQRLFVKNDTQSPSGAFNGIYYVTQIQTAILPPILTRALDYDAPSDINNTGAIPVVNGTVNANTSWLLTSTVNTVGTDPLTFVQFSIAPSSIVTLTGTQTLTNKTLTTPVINGTSTGTGVSSTPTASILAMWDANKNLSANNLIDGFTTTATAAGTTTMDITYTGVQVWTGTTTQTIKLPTTSVVAGGQYTIINNSTGAVTVQSSGANTITVLAASTSATFTAVVATPTTAANWNSQYYGVIVTSGKSLTAQNSLTLAGTDGKTLTLTNSLTVSTNDGTLAFGAASKTFTINNSITIAGTDATTMTFPGASTTVAGLGTTQTFTGINTFTPSARSSGTASYLTINAPADTGITAATESIGLNIVGATRTWADGTTATQREYLFQAPTYNKTTTSATFTKAATLTVAAAPTAGAGVTITNAYALWVQAGLAQFDGAIVTTTINSLTITTSTGTFTLTNAKTFSVTNTLTLSGTDSTTMTFPTTSATIARTDAGQTFTGTQVMTSPKILTSILDTNGNTEISMIATASAVNYVEFTNAATGTTGAKIAAQGETNIDLQIAGKGTGKLHYKSGTYPDLTSDTDGATVTFDLSVSNTHTVTLGGNRTLALSNVAAGQCFILNLVQDATGSRTVTWFTTIKWPGGTVPTLTTGANKTDSFGFQATDSTHFLGYIIGQNL